MAKYRELKTNFVAGEFDELLQGRSDIKHYFNAADLLRNVVVIPQGGARTRPGSRYLWTVPEVSAGVLSNVRLCSFQFSTEQAYLFVFHHLRVTIFRNGAVVATVVTPWTSAQLVANVAASGAMISSGISWTQSLDTLIVFHESYAPRQIQRTGSHSSWSIGNFQLKNIPSQQFSGGVYTNGVDEAQKLTFPNVDDDLNSDWISGDIFRLILEDEETDNIRYSATSAVLSANVQKALRRLPQVTNSGIVVTVGLDDATGIELDVAFTAGDGQRPWGAMGFEVVSSKQTPDIEIYVVTDGEFPGENVWSSERGWPRCGVFFQGRLWMAGSLSLPNTVWASRAGDPNDFNSKRQSVDYGFDATTDTDDVPAFLAIYAGRHLQLFSTAGEFYVPVSESEPISAQNMVLRRTTSRGMKPGLPVYEVDGGTLFVQRLGKTLREFIYADAESAYQANSVSLLASHLMRDPVGMAMRKSSNTDDADFLFMANSDGTMSVFCTLRTQEVNAFTLWNTEGKWLDVKTVLDAAFSVVERQVNGSPVRMLEVFDDEVDTDCAVLGSGVHAAATAAHLGTRKVDVLLDGYVQPQGDMIAGNVLFARDSVSTYEVGIPWPDVHPDYPGFRWLIRTLPPEVQLRDGTMSGRKRRIVNVSMMLNKTTGIVVQGNRVPFQQFGANLLDQPVPIFTGRKHIKALLGWNYDGKIAIGDTIATRATITQLSYQVSV